MLKIPTKALILVAAIVWFCAGSAVASVGVTASSEPWTLTMGLVFLAVLIAFFILFLMIAQKQIRRINGYTDELTELFKFFDAQSYIIMAVMIFLGAAVRVSQVLPDSAIASFYGGLGVALVASSVYYMVTFIASCEQLVAKGKS